MILLFFLFCFRSKKITKLSLIQTFPTIIIKYTLLIQSLWAFLMFLNFKLYTLSPAKVSEVSGVLLPHSQQKDETLYIIHIDISIFVIRSALILSDVDPLKPEPA